MITTKKRASVKEIAELLEFVASEMRTTSENATTLETSQEQKLKDLQALIMNHANDLTSLVRLLKN